jgi:hypothetical protein
MSIPVACPVLRYRDPRGGERSFALREERPITLGRRPEADLSLPWDPEVSRLHAELVPRAGEWVLADEGFSQNGTFVNGIQLEGRRRLHDGDLITVGRTSLTFCDPRGPGAAITLAPAELAPRQTFSEQQQRVLVALCRPLLGDGEGLLPASDEEAARDAAVPPAVAAIELDAIARAFGLGDLPLPERRRETALAALRSGLVRPEGD